MPFFLRRRFLLHVVIIPFSDPQVDGTCHGGMCRKGLAGCQISHQIQRILLCEKNLISWNLFSTVLTLYLQRIIYGCAACYPRPCIHMGCWQG